MVRVRTTWLVTDSATVTMENLPSLFLMVPSLTPYDLSLPQNGGSICPNIGLRE